MSTIHCTGCNRTFTHPRYRLSHLSQTRNLACLAVKQTLFTQNSEASSSGDPPRQIPTTPVSTDCRQITFDNQADLRDEITSHDEDDLGDDEYVDYSVASDIGDEDSDTFDASDDSNDDADNSLDQADMHPNMDDGRRDPSCLLDEPEGTQLQEESQEEPTIVHFPGRRAGEVCSKGIMRMEECENALGGPSENAYSPFASRIDWELAKWAKLRGPSATSFTEMLNISGVSGRVNSFSFIILL